MQQVMANCMNRVMQNIGERLTPKPAMRERDFCSEMEKYFSDMRDGKIDIPEAMAEAMCCAALQAVAKYMGEHEAMKAHIQEERSMATDAHQHDEHKAKYKEVIERLKDETLVNRKKEIIDDCFTGLNEEETSVLLEIATDNSKQFHAKRLRMDVPTFERVKHEAIKKVKIQ